MVFGWGSNKSAEPVTAAAPSFEDQLPTVMFKLFNFLKTNSFCVYNLVTRISS